MTLKSFFFKFSHRMELAATNIQPFKRGEISAGVSLLQAGLIQVGFALPKSARRLGGVPDGIFGAETDAALRAFQSKYKLKVDGVAGAKTIMALDNLLAEGQGPLLSLVPSIKTPNPTPANSGGPTGKRALPVTPAAPTAFTPRPHGWLGLGSNDPIIRHDKGAGIWGAKARELQWSVLHSVMQRSDFLLGARVRTGKDAVAHLEHYLRNTGNLLQVNLAGMIREVQSAKQLLIRAIRDLMDYAWPFPVGSWNLSSTRALHEYNRSQESSNWFFAVGGYSAWIRGTLRVSESKGDTIFEFDGEYKFEDRYNWDGGKSVKMGSITITDEFMGEFHRQGLAKEFNMHGSVGLSFRWTSKSWPSPEQLVPGLLS